MRPTAVRSKTPRMTASSTTFSSVRRPLIPARSTIVRATEVHGIPSTISASMR